MPANDDLWPSSSVALERIAKGVSSKLLSSKVIFIVFLTSLFNLVFMIFAVIVSSIFLYCHYVTDDRLYTLLD